ncbi:penicillin-binding protein [Candidatus Microgenomates bacterium]|nr:penicillin-binding protein [Candidatus Microgenomates bacterium]
MAKRTRRQRRGGATAIVTTAGKAPPKKWWRRWLWYVNPRRFRDFWLTKPGGITLLKIAGTWFGIFLAIVIGLFLYFAKDLPNPDQINSKVSAETTRFYDRTGKTVLYEVHGDQNRTTVELADMSDHIKYATIAIEDKNFYRHGAFSAFGIIRAAIKNVLNWGEVTEGGSTITQQYVKNSLLTSERTFTRKVKELILSIQIEQAFNKDDILKLYLNEIPYGAQAYGVQAAAKTYFDKDAKKLTADEAALLAALPRAPTYYSPYGENVDALLARRDLILDEMHNQGYLKDAEWEKAKETDTYAKVNDVPNLYANVIAPHFSLFAQNYLTEQYGEKQVAEGGYRVITTLDLGLQRKAEKAVKDGIKTVDNLGGDNAALVAGDPNNGHILAMVGSRNFNYKGYGAYNAATARRQPGSSFKPYAYATGFRSTDWGPGSILYDVSTDFGGGYRPENYDHRTHGANTIRWFLGNSFNIPAVKMLYIAGMEETLDTAHSLGITTLEKASDYGLSMVLGAGEVKLADHVNGYESFANGGQHYPATPILKLYDAKNNLIEDNEKPEAKRVLDPQVAYLITNILSDQNARLVTFGYDQNMTISGQTNFTKTGTTDNNRDGWMIGGTRHLVAGVWVGNHDDTPMYGVTSVMSGSIWGPFMEAAHAGKANLPFERPSGIKTVTLDAYTGTLPGPSTKRKVTDIFPSWYKPRPAAEGSSVVINKKNGLLAADCTPTKDRQTISTLSLQAEIPPNDLAFGRWNPPVVALGKSLGYSGKIPTKTDTCTTAKAPSITIDTQKSGSKIIITAEATKGTSKLAQITFAVNDNGGTTYQTFDTCSANGSSKTCESEYDNLDPGKSYKFKVTVVDQAGKTASAISDYGIWVAWWGRLIQPFAWWPRLYFWRPAG